jgi:DNA-binding CsgD family transcriptional regulator
VLLEQHNRRGAVAGLRRAHDAYVQLRARPYLDRCLATLRAGGLEFELPASPSLAALSERELRVARLVAAGLTNKETAQELYVSPKTIEYHLGNIFSKLGISSRRELRALLPNQHRPEPGASKSGLGA